MRKHQHALSAGERGHAGRVSLENLENAVCRLLYMLYMVEKIQFGKGDGIKNGSNTYDQGA